MYTNYTDIVSKIKEKVVLSSVIGKYVRLQKKGVDYWGCCPFHNEKTPSFKVSDKDAWFFCFGCRESGDIFTFLTKFCNFSFQEVVKDLASSLGFDITHVNKNNDNNELSEKKKRIHIYTRIIDYAKNNLLHGKEYAKVLSYLIQKKKFPLDIIKSFNIGVIGNESYICNFLFDTLGLTKTVCVELGLISKNGFVYFANRLLYPIYNQYGEPIGFGARKIKVSTNSMKYINSPESSWFKKREELYALNIAKQYIRRNVGTNNNHNNIYVVEGYTDVISLHSVGYKNTVGILGSSLGLEHLKLLLNYVSEINICFDGDDAGNQAINRSIKMVFEKDPSIAPYIKFIFLPKDKDPHDIVCDSSNKKCNDILDSGLEISDAIIKICEQEFSSFYHKESLYDLPEKVQRMCDFVRNEYISLITDKGYIQFGKDIFYKIKSYFNKKKFEFYKTSIGVKKSSDNPSTYGDINVTKLSPYCIELLFFASINPEILMDSMTITLIEKLIIFFREKAMHKYTSDIDYRNYNADSSTCSMVFCDFLLQFLEESNSESPSMYTIDEHSLRLGESGLYIGETKVSGMEGKEFFTFFRKKLVEYDKQHRYEMIETIIADFTVFCNNNVYHIDSVTLLEEEKGYLFWQKRLLTYINDFTLRRKFENSDLDTNISVVEDIKRTTSRKNN